MRFAAAYAVVAAVFCASISLATVVKIPGVQVSTFDKLPPAITPAPQVPELLKRAPKSSKRPKFTKRPRPRPKRPHNHPKDCTNTELVKNGEFNKNVKNWEFLRGSSAQFFWIKDSKKRPSHSGAGQAYIFLNRGYGEFFLTTSIPAVEYGNSITVSAWLRYEAPADLSSCTMQLTDNYEQSVYMDLNPNWTKYSFESTGTGRPREVQFRVTCFSAPMPITVYLDDVSAKACVPKKPNPECQVLIGADNFLVNPGFECPDGITAWEGSSYYGYGNERIAQFSGTKANPTHSGNGMAGLILDRSTDYFGTTGIAVYQYNIDDDFSRETVKASFWLSVDAKLNNVAGCLLNVGADTGYYLRDIDISNLTTKWTKFEVKGIEPDTRDTFQISIVDCTSPTLPLIYLDDVYFGIDRAAPTASPTTTREPDPEPTSTAGPCTTTPVLEDPSFELGDTTNWLFFDHSDNFDTMFGVDDASTYGLPHKGSAVGVIDFPSPNGSVQLLQQLFGLCNNQAYTATAWFYIPIGYDASVCSFSIGVFAGGEVKPTAAGVWTKAEVVFLASLDSTSIYPYTYIGIGCQNKGEMVVLVDDISFGPPPACSTIPSYSDGSFESGNLTIWDSGVAEGDETIAITTTKAHTGKKSVVLTFPSISNGASFGRDFDACVGGKYTFHQWYFVPKASKGATCVVFSYAYYTGETFKEEVTVYDTWVEAKMDFLAGNVVGHIVFGVSCLNQLQKVVIYLDDVSITTR